MIDVRIKKCSVHNTDGPGFASDGVGNRIAHTARFCYLKNLKKKVKNVLRVATTSQRGIT